MKKPVRSAFVTVSSRRDFVVGRHMSEQGAEKAADKRINSLAHEDAVYIYKLVAVVSRERAPVKVEKISL